MLVYIAALAALLITAFWTVDTFTGKVSTEWTTENVVTVLTDPVYQRITLRTLWVAIAVTLIDLVLALPMAFFIAKVSSPPVAEAAGGGRADAAVGELPGEGLRVAERARRRRTAGVAGDAGRAGISGVR